ncbi:hypothetical protein, partial [Chromobacterium amazonense]|uniref:hypothetical protein n=1 Tax=Chromobacterium amazonense TaxID=1382803 RepID=UPI0031F68E56
GKPWLGFDFEAQQRRAQKPPQVAKPPAFWKARLVRGHRLRSVLEIRSFATSNVRDAPAFFAVKGT